jgi:hypothetical protein
MLEMALKTEHWEPRIHKEWYSLWSIADMKWKSLPERQSKTVHDTTRYSFTDN